MLLLLLLRFFVFLNYNQNELAEKSAGYCGADMKALCSEARLLAVRRYMYLQYKGKLHVARSSRTWCASVEFVDNHWFGCCKS